MRFRLTALALVCVFSLTGTVVHAQPKKLPQQGEVATQGQLIDRTTPDETMNLLKQAGYTDLEKWSDDKGNEQVKGKINDEPVIVFHYYDEGAVKWLSFYAPLGKQPTVDLNYMNSWNFDKLFAKMSQDKEGNTFLQMDIHFFGGASPSFITASGELFGKLIKVLYQYQPGK
jgi:hypothetical protein